MVDGHFAAFDPQRPIDDQWGPGGHDLQVIGLDLVSMFAVSEQALLQALAHDGRDQQVFQETIKEEDARDIHKLRTLKGRPAREVVEEAAEALVNILQAKRLQRKGFETSVLLYGPGVTLGVQRGFPTLGNEAFPGHLNFNNQIKKFMGEGGKVYACRFALQALYGHGEPSLIEGIRPINPLDVMDLVLIHKRDSAVIIDTWTL